MNVYQLFQAVKILSCFNDIEKGGEGSGRHKSLIQELEESNFSPEILKIEREIADEIATEPDRKRKKLFNELNRLEVEINSLYSQALAFDKKRAMLIQQNQHHTQVYHKTVGMVKKFVKLRTEKIKTYREKQKEFNDIND